MKYKGLVAISDALEAAVRGEVDAALLAQARRTLAREREILQRKSAWSEQALRRRFVADADAGARENERE